MEQTLRTLAETNTSGRIGYYSSKEVKDFFMRNKNQRIICHFSTIDGTNKKAFYRNYVLPKIQEAFVSKGSIYSIEEVDIIIRNELPLLVFRHYVENKVFETQRELKDISSEEAGILLDIAIKYAAENLNAIIDSEITNPLIKQQ